MNHASTQRIPSAEDRQNIFRALHAWTGDGTVAEDLTQQTLIEAWKSDRQPECPMEWKPWLFGVARNVMYRWRRNLARDLRRSIVLPESDTILAAAGEDADLDTGLEQQEVVQLLHDILDELPIETREVLLLKYIHELPQAEVAEQLGLNEKALEGRLHRGKQKLRTQILTYRPDTALSLGLVTEPNTWQTTDIWCTSCGMQRLEGRWYDNGSLRLDCPACANGWHRDGSRSQEFSGEIHSQYVPTRPSFRKAMSAVHAVNDTALAAGRDGTWECANCRGMVRPAAMPHDPMEDYAHGDVGIDLCYACDQCSAIYAWRYLPGSGIYTTSGKRFEHRQKRVRMHPPINEIHQNRPAVRSRWEGLESGATFDTWYDLETWKLIDTVASDEPDA